MLYRARRNYKGSSKTPHKDKDKDKDDTSYLGRFREFLARHKIKIGVSLLAALYWAYEHNRGLDSYTLNELARAMNGGNKISDRVRILISFMKANKDLTPQDLVKLINKPDFWLNEWLQPDKNEWLLAILKSYPELFFKVIPLMFQQHNNDFSIPKNSFSRY